MAKKFRLGMVGCGDISRYVALGAKLNFRLEIASCADTNEQRLEAFAAKHKIKQTFTDYRELYEKTEAMDAVYLSVPHYLHRPMILDALEMGIPVFCEKPIACTMDEALDICKTARKTGVKVGINYQYRYDVAAYALARAARKGDLGELYYGRCNLPWHRDDTYFTEAEWHMNCSTSGGGTLITQASHLLDVMLWAMKGKTPVAAMGISKQRRFTGIEVEDLSMGIVEMDDGSLVEVTSSMAIGHEMPVAIEVYGSRGNGYYSGPEKPRVKFYGVKVKKEKPPVWQLHALFRSMEGFRRWVLFESPYLTPAEEALPVLAAVTCIYKSAETGKMEEVDRRYLEYYNRNE